eukprot:9973708-Alexandrium_andersonii.AAC.1
MRSRHSSSPSPSPASSGVVIRSRSEIVLWTAVKTVPLPWAMSRPVRRPATPRCRASLMGSSCCSAQPSTRPTWGNFPVR